jgi:hypothetical protein
MVTDYEADYLVQPFAQKVLEALASESAVAAIPEVSEIVLAVSTVHSPLDYVAFQRMLRGIFATYVVEEFKAMSTRNQA